MIITLTIQKKMNTDYFTTNSLSLLIQILGQVAMFVTNGTSDLYIFNSNSVHEIHIPSYRIGKLILKSLNKFNYLMIITSTELLTNRIQVKGYLNLIIMASQNLWP